MSADEMKDIIAKDRLQYEMANGSSKNMKVPKSVSSKSKKAQNIGMGTPKPTNSEKSSAVSSGGDGTDKSLANEPST
jgi:hypothetical protein